MTDNNVVSLDKIKVACANCGLATLCLPMGLNNKDIESLDTIVKRNKPMHRGDYLFRMGEHFHSLYVVKTGSVKTYTHYPDGSEQVVGFHLPGEIIGLDAIEKEEHTCAAKALETTAVCELPYENLESLSAQMPSLQHQMFRLLSREIHHESEMLALLGKSTAEERLAAFLISLSDRYKQRGFSATEFFLSMSRQEIGSYLGLALETVSRLFTRLQEEGILRVERKHIEILNMQALQSLFANQPTCITEVISPS